MSRSTDTTVAPHVGKQARYYEDDWVAVVTILENDSDKEWERYKLRVDRTEKPSRIYTGVPDGTEFSVDKKRGMAFGLIWTLALL